VSGDVMAPVPLVQHFDLIAQAPGGVARLRELILTLAVQGKLVPQDQSDEPASELLKKIRVEKERLIAEGKIKRDKPLAEITDEEKPFELPAGWQFCRLGQLLLSIRSGGTPSKQNPEFWNGDIPWASVKDLHFGEPVSDTQDRITRAGLDAGSELAPKGSILICTRMGLGKIGEALIDVAINQDLKAVLLGEGVDKQYFINYFKTLTVVGSGMTVAGIKQDELLSFVVPLPSLAEQSRIVTRVKELMQVCDALEASGQLEAQQHAQLVSTLLGTLTQSETPEALADNWQRIATHFDVLLDRPEAVDALEQTILQLAVRGLLVPQDLTDEPSSVLLQKIRTEKDQLIAQGKIKRDKPLPPITDEEKPFELPQGWEWARLGDVGVTQTGGTPNKNDPEHFGNDIPFIKPGDIYPERVNYQNEGLSSQGAESLGRIAEAGSILMVCIGTIGKSNLIDRSCSFNQQINSVTPILILPEYLLAVLCSPYFQDEAWARSSSTTISILNKGKWESIPIPVPPLQEQSRILSRFDDCKRFNRELKIMLTEAVELSRKISAAIVSVSPA
jgi:type I restriction enzyme, S subunit